MRVFQFLFAVVLLNPEARVEQLRRQGATAIRLQRIQLDSDEQLEAVVQYELADSGVHAIVLDSRGSEWREVGKFNSWWNFTKPDAERFLEFRETVQKGVQDILVRTRTGGTEESRTALELHRLKEGVLVNVLTVTESSTAMEHPSGDVFTTITTLSYAPGRITAKSIRNPGNRQTCVTYLWSASLFRFEADASAAGASCP
jgi:hypothetical protein